VSDTNSTSASATVGFTLGAAGGFLIWLFSEPLTGRREPWDGAVLWYLVALFVLGFVIPLGLRTRPFPVYWGALAGQILFGLVPFAACLLFGALCTDQANLFPLGAVILVAFTLPALVGALLGARARALLMR
jgi:hypothetical protein